MESANACANVVRKIDHGSMLPFTRHKLAVELTQDDTEETILNYLNSGFYNFGLNLFYGSVAQNLEVVDRLRNVVKTEQENIRCSIPLSIYLMLSPRLQYTGRFKRNRPGVHLKRKKRLILTTNRNYASQSCHSYIYINARFLIPDIKRCDIIRLGKYVQVQVMEVQTDQVKCKVLVEGFVESGSLVRFPKRFDEAHSKISAEELEDITFALGTNIQVIVSHTPGCENYFSDLKQSMETLKCQHFYLFTRLTLSCLENESEAIRICEAYNGFLIDCKSKKVPTDDIFKLPSAMKKLMELAYMQRKPIFLQGCWSSIIDPSEFNYAFQYPDKYIVPCELNFLRLFEAFFHTYCQTELWDFEKALSMPNVLARAVAAASYEFQAGAIVVNSTVGEMAIRISHYRPKAIIVAVTGVDSVINYLTMHHNICMLLFKIKGNMTCSHKEETYQKLLYGIQFAALKEIVDTSSSIILVFRESQYCGRVVDKFAVIKYNDNYENTLKNIIEN